MKVQDETTALQSLASPELPKLHTFQEFRKIGRSSTIILIFNIVFSCCYAPLYLLNHYYFHPLPFDDPAIAAIFSYIQLLFLAMAIICSWIVFSLFSTTDPDRLILRQRIKTIFVTSLTLLFSLEMISHLFLFVEDSSTTNGYATSVAALLLLLIPPASLVIFRVTEDSVVVICWLITALSFLTLVIVAPTPNTITVLLSYLIMSVLVLLDRYYFTTAVYDYYIQLEKRIEEYTKNATEKKAQEMRGLMATLAHDLKTPLTSFMTAVEMIAQDMTTCQIILPTPETDFTTFNFEKVCSQVKSSSDYILMLLQSIREIHAFMLMMINRSIDFKKASAGINLVPTLETIDLSTVVKMPVHCLQNMQQKIGVRYDGLDAKIHPWIKTDPHWLQENLLCLLSNAVKYSTTDEVELRISLQTTGSLKKVAGKIVDEVQVKPHHHHSISTSIYEKKEEDSYFSSSSRNKPSTSRFTFSSPRFRRTPDNSLYANTTASRAISREENSSCSSPPSINSNLPLQRLPVTHSIVDVEDPAALLTPVVSDLEHRECLLFEVTDRGPGLSPSAMQAIFNPFKQSRWSGGTGLGLYSLAKRVEALGGLYGIHNREDGKSGSVIWFTIPYDPVTSDLRPAAMSSKSTALPPATCIVVAPAPTLSPVVPIPSKKEETAVLDTPCILVVDDAPMIVKMTCMLLKRQNIDTDIAENGKIALEKVIASYSTNKKYSAILMDFQMPEMDGIEATKRIREYESQHHIAAPLCIIGISAMSDAALIEEGKTKGISAFLPKPFANKDFMSFIQQLQN